MSQSEVEWRCRRSILELDILISRFFKSQYDLLSVLEKKQFFQLLLLEDPALMALMMDNTQDDPLLNKIRLTMGFEGSDKKSGH
ncbi:succinate dehydrogenase assembly factor 2 [Candidatus Synchoanobacter obligatus]|jgi:antitoxin CptB|uniref:FAD assembly factor SdhE n=1 Tax=Candidatus Synchoanobacter obligatus TaxID=2919597 RepID=A0ABT1L439_9GAMM|nr:succinate dehydrogenase assembly factor 2 [Candidatus Synchoanobacter obligatus]MCP8351940.1 succinate dehydrogenase assembly factor 2 [Candidatus Synchoanobacter obligatus]